MFKDDYTIKTNLKRLFIQRYERYLPTAFDESMTILEKMNKLIESHNTIIGVVNTHVEFTSDQLERAFGIIDENLGKQLKKFRDELEEQKTLYEQLRDHMYGDLLPDTVKQKLEEWLLNGTIKDLIEDTVFPDWLERLYIVENRLSHLTVSVKDFGVVADGVTDDTIALQEALDSGVPVLSFPQGTMLTGPLFLRRNTDLIGSGMRKSILRGRFLEENDDLLTVAIESTYDGSGDVRGLRIEGLSFMNDLKGRDSLHFGDGLSNTNVKIAHNYMSAPRYGLYTSFDVTHSEITQNQWEKAYFEFGDANKIHKNLTFGEGYGMTIDIIRGVRNNIIRDNTMVNNHGAVRIVNGDNIRIVNNQIEKIGTDVEGTSMVNIVGRDRPCLNTVISENNFGGGSHVDYNVYIGNADKTVIEKNNLIRGDLGHFNITTGAKNTVIKNDNYVYSWENKPSASTDIKDAEILNNGINTIGIPIKPLVLRSWSGGDMLKDETGLISMSEIEHGENTLNAQIIKLPIYYRPSIKELNVIGDDGFKKLKVGLNGRVMLNENIGEKCVFLPFNATDDVIMNTDLDIYDDFLRGDNEVLGTMPTAQVWTDRTPGLEIVNNEATPPLNDSNSDFAMSTFNSGVLEGELFLRVSRIPREVSDDVRLIFRYIDQNNYCYVQIKNTNGNKFIINTVVNGVDTNIKTIWGVLGNKTTIKLKIKGSNIELYENNMLVTSVIINMFTGSSTHGIAIKSRYSRIDAIGFNRF